MSEKDCGHHQDQTKKMCCCLCGAISAFIFLILFTILLSWIIVRPAKPDFMLQDVTLNTFDFSSSTNVLTSNIQITLKSRNPNTRLGFYYDRLDVFATYQSQQITLPILLPATYQGHKEESVWSPLLTGNNNVLVSPYIETQDQTVGTVLINVKVRGRMRWKVGTYVSGEFNLNVNCPVSITVGSKNNNWFAVGQGIKNVLLQSCNVDY